MSVNLEKFELKIDSIIAHCAKLQKENLSLKKENQNYWFNAVISWKNKN